MRNLFYLSEVSVYMKTVIMLFLNGFSVSEYLINQTY